MSTSQPSARLRPFEPIQFGRYTLVHPLSTGGMGEIYLARMSGAQGFEKLCVIKKLLPELAEDPDFVQRFVNEAKTLVKLSHGSIAQVLDMGLHEGDPYIALEFVDGKDLRKVISRERERDRTLPLVFSLYVMGRVLDALAYAHRKRDEQDREINLVHRDVSPPNILISYEGEVKLIDFGLAKSALNSARTNPSIVLGKFLYMSPEQARHQKVDRRSDLYSAGICLYELLAGHHPYESITPGDLMSMVAHPSLPSLEIVAPGCPGKISDLVMRALSVDPEDRYASAEEFRGKVVAALMELDPTAGAETVSKVMRETFAPELGSERRVLSFLQDPTAAVTPGSASADTSSPPLPTPAAVPVLPLLTPARPAFLTAFAPPVSAAAPRAAASVLPRIAPEPLSFAPTLRTHPDDGGESSPAEATVPQYASAEVQPTVPQFRWPARPAGTGPGTHSGAHHEMKMPLGASATDPELLEVTDPRVLALPEAPEPSGAAGVADVSHDGPTVVRAMPVAPPSRFAARSQPQPASPRRFPELARFDQENGPPFSEPPVRRDTDPEHTLPAPMRELEASQRPTPRMAPAPRPSPKTFPEASDAADEIITAHGRSGHRAWLLGAVAVALGLGTLLYVERVPLGVDGLWGGSETGAGVVTTPPPSRSPLAPVPPPTPVKHPEPSPPVGGGKGVKKPAVGLSMDDTDLLVPLTMGKRPGAALKRRAPVAAARNAVLLREWARTRGVFKRLEANAFCETDGAGPVCELFHTVEGAVAVAGPMPDDELLAKVRELRRTLERRGAP